jgi:Fe2+ or Zn2+ uptake regulation protein
MTNEGETMTNDRETPSMKEARIVRQLQAARLRLTLTRIKALEMLSEHPGLQNADAIHRWLAGQGIPGGISTIHHALRSLHQAGFLLRVQDLNHRVRYCLKPETGDIPSLRLVCRDGAGGKASFSDPELYAQLLSVAAREGLPLKGREFELRVRFERQDAEGGERKTGNREQ